MYCSSCGVAVAQGLSYCNYCGAKLGEGKSDSLVKSEVKPELVVSAMVATFVLGLIAITALIGVMKSVLGLDAAQILAFASLSFLIMIILEGVFLRLLFRRHRPNDEARVSESLKGQTTKELDAAQARALREPGLSVTEHTTRAFEPIYTEPNKGE
jgi:hypothetical protein